VIWLLDTNVISNAVRYHSGNAARMMRDAPDGTVGTSIVVTAELRFGYARSPSARLEQQVEALLEGLEIVGWDEPCDRVYAALRSDLERRGALIGPMDMMIAAHALALDAVLVTDNEREFRRVAGLKVENWIR
jgi:tRNA(fMet)-specific endonuclease VapC